MNIENLGRYGRVILQRMDTDRVPVAQRDKLGRILINGYANRPANDSNLEGGEEEIGSWPTDDMT